MAEQDQTLFRKKTLDRISSPEQLTDYLKVTNPGIWMVLAAVIILLAGLIVWASVGTIETSVDAKVIVSGHTGLVVTSEAAELASGMPLKVASGEYVIVNSETDEYGRMIGIAEVELPDGTYDGSVVVESFHPIRLLFESGS
ncbi:MAG: hypothetical protein J6X33_01695 [Clostridiales bacterium]|nr:hypothetical protein [Clostridiales bacterium]